MKTSKKIFFLILFFSIFILTPISLFSPFVSAGEIADPMISTDILSVDLGTFQDNTLGDGSGKLDYITGGFDLISFENLGQYGQPNNQKIKTKKDILRIRRKVISKLIHIHEYYNSIIVILGKRYLEVIEPLIDSKFLVVYDKRGIGGYLSLLSRYNKLPRNQLLKELEKFRMKNYQSEIAKIKESKIA